MKTVTLKLDWVTKTLLLIIAVSLLVIAFKPLLPTELQANPSIVDVNIAEIGGYNQYGTTFDVSGSVSITNPDEIGWYVDYYTR